MADKLIIVKIGTKTLVDEKGQIKDATITNVLEVVKERMEIGEKIIIVTSGAVAAGRAVLGKKDADRSVAAGIGQTHLLSHYLNCARPLGLHISEMLISRPHLVRRNQFLQLQEKINKVFSYEKVVPVVNENDFLVAGSDWSFGDNDSLAAALAISFKAEKLIILSHVDGLYTADPTKDKTAELIDVVDNVNAELMKCCSTESSDVGCGGMISKLRTARICTAVGIEVQIINGAEKTQIERAFQGERVGTTILPRGAKDSIKNRERWILSAKSSTASIEVDDGAVDALRRGKSLLAVGVKKIFGDFENGEIVEIVNHKQEGIAFGLVDINSKELKQKPFAKQSGAQVMHADNIVVFG